MQCRLESHTCKRMDLSKVDLKQWKYLNGLDRKTAIYVIVVKYTYDLNLYHAMMALINNGNKRGYIEPSDVAIKKYMNKYSYREYLRFDKLVKLYEFCKVKYLRKKVCKHDK